MIGLFVAAIAAHICYDRGFDHGTAEAEARQADAVKIAQNEVKKDYEKRIQELSASIERLRSDNAQRLRQLEAYSKRERSLETCSRDLSAVSVLAIEGERLLKEADGYLRAFEH